MNDLDIEEILSKFREDLEVFRSFIETENGFVLRGLPTQLIELSVDGLREKLKRDPNFYQKEIKK